MRRGLERRDGGVLSSSLLLLLANTLHNLQDWIGCGILVDDRIVEQILNEGRFEWGE